MGSPSRLERIEAHPRLHQPFDEPVVLLDNVVEVFDWPQFTLFWNSALGFELTQRFGGCRVFIDRDHWRHNSVRGAKRFREKALGRCCIACFAEEELERVADRESTAR